MKVEFIEQLGITPTPSGIDKLLQIQEQDENSSFFQTTESPLDPDFLETTGPFGRYKSTIHKSRPSKEHKGAYIQSAISGVLDDFTPPWKEDDGDIEASYDEGYIDDYGVYRKYIESDEDYLKAMESREYKAQGGIVNLANGGGITAVSLPEHVYPTVAGAGQDLESFFGNYGEDDRGWDRDPQMDPYRYEGIGGWDDPPDIVEHAAWVNQQIAESDAYGYDEDERERQYLDRQENIQKAAGYSRDENENDARAIWDEEEWKWSEERDEWVPTDYVVPVNPYDQIEVPIEEIDLSTLPEKKEIADDTVVDDTVVTSDDIFGETIPAGEETIPADEDYGLPPWLERLLSGGGIRNIIFDDVTDTTGTTNGADDDEEDGPIFVGPPKPPIGPPESPVGPLEPPIGPPKPPEETILEKLKGMDWQQILGILSLLGLGGAGLSKIAGDSTGGITGLLGDGDFADPGAAGFADMPGGGVGLPTYLGGDTSRAPIYYPFASEPTKEYNVARGGPFSFTTGPPQESLIQNLGYTNVPGVEYVAHGAFIRRNGLTEGPGTTTSDDIPAMLSDGEFVTNAEANRGIGLMALMNQGAPQQEMMDPEQQRLAGARQMYMQQALGQQMARKMRGG